MEKLQQAAVNAAHAYVDHISKYGATPFLWSDRLVRCGLEDDLDKAEQALPDARRWIASSHRAPCMCWVGSGCLTVRQANDYMGV